MTATPTEGGTRCRPFVVDGPFAEAKEVVVGYFVLDAASLTTLSSRRRRHELERLRVVRRGSIDVRRLRDLGEAVDSAGARSS